MGEGAGGRGIKEKKREKEEAGPHPRAKEGETE